MSQTGSSASKWIESLEGRQLLSAGDLDSSFGAGGKFVATPDTGPGLLLPTDLAVQPDGKLLYSGVGVFDVGAVVRLNANGTVDTSFGDQGLAKSGYGNYGSTARAVAVGPGGKIAVAGIDGPFTNFPPVHSTLVVYDSTGKVDKSFSGDGVLTAFQYTRGFADVTFRSDGDLVVVGEKLLRYNPNGTPDTAFGGGDGVVDVSGKKVLVDANGKVVVLGHFALFRFNADGTPDATFDGDGVRGGVKGHDLALAPDGDILVIGNGGNLDQLSRFNANGSADTAFGHQGNVFVPGGISLAVDATDVYVGSTIPSPVIPLADFEIRAYTHAGKPDLTFGAGGRVLTDVNGARQDALVSLALQQGKLVALGSTKATVDTPPVEVQVPAVARYQLGGTVTPPPQSPFGTLPIALPGVIEAENFDRGGEGVAYHDTEPASTGVYRPADGVDVQATTDAGGGHAVAFVKAGEWLEYTVDVPAGGTFDVDFRVAHLRGGGKFHLEVDGANVTGSLTVPNTGDWNKYATVTKTGVTLSAGTHMLRLAFDANGAIGYVGNFNRIALRKV